MWQYNLSQILLHLGDNTVLHIVMMYLLRFRESQRNPWNLSIMRWKEYLNHKYDHNDRSERI